MIRDLLRDPGVLAYLWRDQGEGLLFGFLFGVAFTCLLYLFLISVGVTP